MSEVLDEVGIDFAFISPRPYTMMHSAKPEKLVHWYCQAVTGSKTDPRTGEWYDDVKTNIEGIPWPRGRPTDQKIFHKERHTGVYPLPARATATNESPKPAGVVIRNAVDAGGALGA